MTIIDTPGFGMLETKDEEEHIIQLVKVLKKQVKHVHVFLIAIKEGTDRYTKELDTMFKLFGTIFGNKFWHNAMVTYTQYNFADFNIKARKGRGETESTWTDAIITQLKNRTPYLKKVSFKHSSAIYLRWVQIR